jgi:exopolysaccharide biosynthesis predicted pyruvyltransferase EpsI
MSTEHRLLDNSYGKIFDYYETWTKESPLAVRDQGNVTVGKTAAAPGKTPVDP